MVQIPESLRRRAAEAEGWLELRCPQKAIEKIQPLLDTPDARPAGLYLRTRALIDQGEHAEALKDLAELRPLGTDPDWVDLTEAWCLKRLGRLEDAVARMEEMIARSHQSAIGHFNLGCYLALLGQKDRAIDEVTLACGLSDDYRKLAVDEEDLASLRGDPRFDELLP